MIIPFIHLIPGVKPFFVQCLDLIVSKPQGNVKTFPLCYDKIHKQSHGQQVGTASRAEIFFGKQAVQPEQSFFQRLLFLTLLQKSGGLLLHQMQSFFPAPVKQVLSLIHI